MDILAQAAAGLETLPVDQRFKRAALENLTRWWEDPRLSADRPQIEGLVARGRWEQLLDCFYQMIPFGTGGRRGTVGVGTNRINPWTISTSVQGHAEWLRESFGDEASVVVAYDVRCFRDARSVWDPSRPNPLMGVTSRALAEIAAGVYAANGVTAHILPRGGGYMSTPELSFAIRHLKASGGLNISASHNPPDDNGAKVYNHLGGQEVPPRDEALADRIAAVDDVKRIEYADGLADGSIREIGADVHAAYVETNLSCSLDPSARSAKVVFTSLHGTGDRTVYRVLEAAGFETTLEPSQAAHDGAFPTVPFGTPNPEVPQSMDRAAATADALGADLVMACDPDADRLGVMVKHQGGWRFLTGNEMAALVVRYGLVRTRRERPVVIKTEVTSSLIARVARAHGAQVVGHLLVGFKYIGEGMRLLEQIGSFYNAEGGLDDFLVGVEESHGVLVSPNIRDKDAAGAALWLAEAASIEKAAGRTLVDALEDCWREVGYVSNTLVSTVMRGATGRIRIEEIQDSIRKDPPREIDGRRVLAFHDRADPRGPFGRIRSGTDAASRNVLVFELEGDARLILRPSGTEPKNKTYVEVASAPGAEVDVAGTDAACRQLAKAFVRVMLLRVGLDVPTWALDVSGLVAVEKKAHFAQSFMPELLTRLEEGGGEETGAWIDAALASYGKDGRGLVAGGVASFLAARPQSPEIEAALRTAFGI